MNSIIKPVPTDYNTYLFYIEELIRDFPFLNAEIQGRTAVGRGIFSLSLGNRKNAVLIAGGFCGSEIMTVNMLLLFTESLCRCVKYARQLWGVDVKRALSQLGITLIPCVNPDGCEIHIKGFEGAKSLRHYAALRAAESGFTDGNAMGVDLKKNFFAAEAYERSIAGQHRISEAETKTLSRLCKSRDFRSCLSLECGDKLLLRHGNRPQSVMMAKILADSCGCTYRDSHNNEGLSRWFSESLHKPAFTLKADKGCSPLPAQSLYYNYARLEEALLLFCLM